MSFITKTACLTFIHCPKAFWLQEHQPHLAAPPDPAAQRRFRVGQEVDQLARELFPTGIHIPYRPQPEDMAPLTMQAIADGADTLFQATFVVDDLLIKADVLTRVDSLWRLIEVKSSTSAKPEHLPDLAFQAYVLGQAGIDVEETAVLHLNNACQYPNLADLFTLTDVTDDTLPLLASIPDDVRLMRQTAVSAQPPAIPIGRHCTKPDICPFYDHCWQGVDSLTIYDIPRLGAKRERPLQAANILHLADIPADADLTAKQREFVEFFVAEQINIDRVAIQQAMAQLVYPLYFFDFETIDYAIPKFHGCKPYQQVPFQYSCHILDVDGTLTHVDYLHMDEGDPRRPLTETLLSHIGDTGSLVAYNIPFERGVLLALADHLPEYADRLRGVADRLWDQLPIFRNHYRDYRFGKSNSLKSVLPVIAPELSYKMLDVQNGAQAQVVWEEMIVEGDTAVKAKLAAQLRKYCHLDTLAMVEIHYALLELAS
ncbi:MAG: DUF2779 domain-containing protein [Anaerolineales bacterium]|nr:DUF2779 domain-containing protein [Anaerolineales bacterium]